MLIVHFSENQNGENMFMADIDPDHTFKGPTILFRKISNCLSYKNSDHLLLIPSPVSKYGKSFLLFLFAFAL